MKRAMVLLLLMMPLTVPAAEPARAKGMTIFGDQEMPHVRTELPWRNIDVDALEQESIDDIIRGIVDESDRLASQRNRELTPARNEPADFRGLLQAWRQNRIKQKVNEDQR